MMKRLLLLFFLLSCVCCTQSAPISSRPTLSQREQIGSGQRVDASAYNWRFTDNGGSLGSLSSAGTRLVVTLPCTAATPCAGLDTSHNPDAPYGVLISGTGADEVAIVTGGTCSVFATASCTLQLTTWKNHPKNYAIGSATSGVQERLNYASMASAKPSGGVVDLEPTSNAPNAEYDIFTTVFQKSAKSLLVGYGAVFHCFTRRPCHIIGDYAGIAGKQATVMGLEYQPEINVDGALIKQVSAQSGLYTVTTATNHSFQTGDYVILYYSTPARTQEGRFKITVTGPNQFQYSVGRNSFAAAQGYGWALLENAPVEVISQEVTMRDIKVKPGSRDGRFDVGIVNSIDQSFQLDGYTNEGSGGVFQCTPNMCAPMFYARGDQGAAPVSYIRHADFSLQCGGNGVRNASGNTLTVEDSVIQGFSQYGAVYASAGGGLQPWMAIGIYQESSRDCYNWFYPHSSYSNGTGKGLVAQAGFLTNGQIFDLVSDYPIGGASPFFTADNPSTSQQENNYYVIPHSSEQRGYGPMLHVGTCLSIGKGNCYLAWPNIDLHDMGTVTWDILVTFGNSGPPYPGNANAIATGISGSCGPSGVCTYTDPQKGTSPYTMTKAVFAPLFSFWPGAIVLGNSAKVYLNRCGQSAEIISSSYLPTVFCQQSVKAGGAAAVYTPYWGVSNAGDPVDGGVIGARLQPAGPAGGSPPSGRKGFENLLNPSTLGMTDLFTFVDSNPFKTLATPGYQPAWDATDTAFGTDSPPNSAPSAAQFYERCGAACSLYVGVVPDGKSWVERATTNHKVFNVPVTTLKGISVSPSPVEKLPACNAELEGTHASVTDSTVNTFGGVIKGGGKNHVPAYCNGTNWVVD